jgi:hypothetical protein
MHRRGAEGCSSRISPRSQLMWRHPRRGSDRNSRGGLNEHDSASRASATYRGSGEPGRRRDAVRSAGVRASASIAATQSAARNWTRRARPIARERRRSATSPWTQKKNQSRSSADQAPAP